MKIRIILTGTGAGELPYVGEKGESFRRHHSSAVIEVELMGEKHYIHIDFTPFAAYGLVRANIPYSKINNIFFSHAHEDHFDPYRLFATKLNIGDVRFDFDPKFQDVPMNVYAPKPVIRATVRMLGRKDCYYSGSNESEDSIYYCYQGIKSKKEKKELLRLWGVKENSVISISPNIRIKCIGAVHEYDSVISSTGKGNIAFGFLISIQRENREFNVFYATDFANFGQEDLFRKNIAGYPIDLLILGMPVPFPNEKEIKKHMSLEDTLRLFRDLQEEGLVKKGAPIILTHLSDRWGKQKTLDRAKKIIRAHWSGNRFWIPEEDGFEIIREGRATKKKGKIKIIK